MPQFPKMLYAHRGANIQLPENTLEAFRHGLQAGANALELDVRRTKDDVIIVFHDADGLRVAGQNAFVKHCTLEQVQKWNLTLPQGPDPVARYFTGQTFNVPSLFEVIEAFPGIFLNVDIKAHDLRTVSLVIDEVAKFKAHDRVRLTSESLRVTQMIRSLRYQGPIGLSAWEIARLYFLPQAMLARSLEGRAAQVPLRKLFFRMDQKHFVEKCHALGVRVDFWVVNDRETASYLASIGVDGIMTDDPSMLQSVFIT